MWTLESNGTVKSLSEWGVSALRRRLVNQNPDEVRMRVDSAAVDAAFAFSPETEVVLRKNGQPWFRGLVTQIPAYGSGSREHQDYVVAGPWWHLENLVFQQVWNEVIDPANPLLDTVEKGRLVLGQASNGSMQNSGGQIAEAVQYAIAQGAPMQLGTVDVAVSFPLDEAKDLSCAEVIRRMLRWSSEAVCWFDYSTLPYPTLHVTRRANMSTATINAGSGDCVETLEIAPRHDLQRPAVVLKYEKTHRTDEAVWTTTAVDRYPADATGREFKALVMTINLGGLRANYLRQEIEVDTINEDTGAWWKSQLPELEGILSQNIIVHSTSRTSQLPNELTGGQIADWMDVEAEEDEVRATLSWHDDDQWIVRREVLVRLVATDAQSRTYRKLVSSTPEEATPIGLATALHASVNELHYDGRVTLVEDEVSGAAHPGQVLNLSGLRPEWAAMRALVQEVREDVDEGRTRVRFGPPEHLGPADLAELLRVNRRREATRRASTRTSGQPDEVPEIPQAKHGRLRAGGAGAGRYRKLTFVDPDNEDRTVVIDAAELPQTLAVQLRPEYVCENGTLKQRYTLCSEPYTLSE